MRATAFFHFLKRRSRSSGSSLGSHSAALCPVSYTHLDVYKRQGKGAAAARLGEALCGRAGGAAAGLGAVVGHSWPVFAGFRGGKSSATLFGAVSVLTPPVAGVSLVAGVTALAVSRRTSVLSLSGSAAGGLAAVVLGLRRRDTAGLALAVPGLSLIHI